MAMVETSPEGVTTRMLPAPESAMIKLPSWSRVMPEGFQKRAVEPWPSATPN